MFKGSWWFGGSPVSSDSNFLRVINAFPNRRLSDNTLMAPKIRIAPSCASSPGGTPGGSTGGLPIRRHSSIGPQERRGSTINLSPPTVSSLLITLLIATNTIQQRCLFTYLLVYYVYLLCMNSFSTRCRIFAFLKYLLEN